MRISDWSSDVCSSDLGVRIRHGVGLSVECGCRIAAFARADSPGLLSLLHFPRVDDVEAGRLERHNVARGDGEAASRRNGGDIAVWSGEALAGGSGRNGQPHIVPGCAGVVRTQERKSKTMNSTP